MNNFVNYFALRCNRCKICNVVIGSKQKKGCCDNCIKKQQAKLAKDKKC